MKKIIAKWLKSGIATKRVEDLAVRRDNLRVVGEGIGEKTQKLFGRSLHIREVDTGSCNACELEINALCNPVYDIERLGIHFVASPRHADVLLVTGPVTRNLEMALKKTYNATPGPRCVIAVGDCAVDGGVFKDSYAVIGGASKVIPVNAYIKGCPPRPQELLQAILQSLNRLK